MKLALEMTEDEQLNAPTDFTPEEKGPVTTWLGRLDQLDTQSEAVEGTIPYFTSPLALVGIPSRTRSQII
jgi:hypothetical protein